MILRDMAQSEGSTFDPAKKWEEEKANREAAKAVVAPSSTEKNKKGKDKKKSTADTIKETNAADKLKKENERDLQKLSNLKSLKALQDMSCDTVGGKIHRMLKMLYLAASDLRQGSVNSSEAEVLDILWALEEMPAFKDADEQLSLEKAAKKEAKKS